MRSYWRCRYFRRGPRPLPLYKVEKLENTAQRRRLSVKSVGLTCLWQISGRNQVRDFRDWVRLDLDYIDRWSLALDFKILLRTIPAVIMGLGAKSCRVETYYIYRDRIRAGGARLIIWRVARKHPLDVLGQNVEFNVDQGADLDVVDVGVPLGVGNDPDGEALP